MEPLSVGVRVLAPEADAESVQDLTHNLREALLDADVDDVRPATAGPPPPGAKSAEAVALGSLVVTLAPTVLENLFSMVSSWLSRQSADVQVEIDGNRFQGRVTNSQRDELLRAYLSRVDPRP
jgi:membrane-associated two-gene conflict system component 1 (EACC1)